MVEEEASPVFGRACPLLEERREDHGSSAPAAGGDPYRPHRWRN